MTSWELRSKISPFLANRKFCSPRFSHYALRLRSFLINSIISQTLFKCPLNCIFRMFPHEHVHIYSVYLSMVYFSFSVFSFSYISGINFFSRFDEFFLHIQQSQSFLVFFFLYSAIYKPSHSQSFARRYFFIVI